MSKKKVNSKGSKSAAAKPSVRSSGAFASASPMDVVLLERIVKLMAANDLNTVDLRDGEQRVVLMRGAPAGFSGPPIYSAQAPAPSGTSPGVPASTGTGSAPPNDESNFIPIKSPMVGTFYTAATPDARPFVQVGSIVDEDTDVCIIEAMKVFNNIKAEMRGTIAKVFITNGQTVEFGQTLFLVKP